MIDIILPTSFFALSLGIVHAFEADHIAAVSTMVARTHGVRKSSLLGALWGLGHTTTLLLVGCLLLILRVSVPTSLSVLFETIVAVILIALGVGTMREVKKGRLHAHTHTHGENEHAHVHVHNTPSVHDHRHTPFVVGLFHGLAGSGALALAAVASSHTLVQGAIFIGLFGLGSVIGMVVLSATIGLIMKHAARFIHLHTSLMLGSGALCIVVALTLLPIPECIEILTS
jgi:sulfite exporter TauE/SafE